MYGGLSYLTEQALNQSTSYDTIVSGLCFVTVCFSRFDYIPIFLQIMIENV